MNIEEQSLVSDRTPAKYSPPHPAWKTDKRGIENTTLQATLKTYRDDRKGQTDPGDRLTPRVALTSCLILALLVRLWLVIHTHGVIDGDEALVGIQAQHILQGERPVYFYAQAYMGSLEAYLVALLFAVAGSSMWVFRSEAILLSLLIVWLTWRLATVLADFATCSINLLPLPQRGYSTWPINRRWFISIATLFAAVPPLYDTVAEMHMLGGYIETFVLMLLLLLSTLQLTRRWWADATSCELAWRWAGIGLIVGLGLWVNPLIVSAILAAAIWLIWGIWRRRARGLFLAVAALPTCLVGLSPALFWGATHKWQNVSYLLAAGGNTYLRPQIHGWYPTRGAIFTGLVNLYRTCVGPRVLSGALPAEDSLLLTLHNPTLISGLLCISATVILVALSFMRPYPLLLVIRRLAALPLLFAACTLLVFCATTAAAPGLWSCNFDVAGRYATPIMLVLPFFFATVAAAVAASRPLGVQGASPPAGAWGVPKNPPFSLAAAGGKETSQILLLVLLLVSLCTQLYTYVLTDPGLTFQSPYCPSAPANDGVLINYMQHEHIRYVWASNWIAYPLVFKTNGAIIAADPRPLIHRQFDLNRIPNNTDAVIHADRPSMISMVWHGDRHPLLPWLLDTNHVTYRLARFPSEPGTDVLVVTPLNRTVLPLDMRFSAAFVCNLANAVEV